MNMSKKAQEILEAIESGINQPFVTAKFGDNWRERYREMLAEGQITTDMLLDIAWKQGRRSLLLEDAIARFVKDESSSPLPKEETQDELWRELIDTYDLADAKSYGYATIINKLSKLYTIRKNDLVSSVREDKAASTLGSGFGDSIEKLIKKHLDWHPTDLRMASVQHFCQTGTVSGSLFEAIKKIATESSNQNL